jgi:hypothetical protein
MELGDPDQEPAPAIDLEPDRSSRGFWMFVVLALALLVGTATYVMWRRPAATPADQKATAADKGAGVPAPLGPEAPAIEVPPLNMTDPLVRQLIGQLSSRPEIAAWLATEGLIRNFVVSVENVATGPTPVKHLRPLAPTQPFRVVERGREIVVDPQSYQRYDGLVSAVGGIDPNGLARVYSILKPRMQEAYKELGHPDGNFDAALETAIVRLLEVPVVENDVRLRPSGATAYEFEDDRLEALSPAQKQLLRMGPRNVRQVQEKLRAVARALQIPDERLPAARGG